MPFPIKQMFLVEALGTVSKVVAFAIDILECIWIEFILPSFWYRWVYFRVSFAVPYYLLVMFKLVGSATLLASSTMYLVCMYSMSPFPVVFTLQNPRVYVSTSESGYMASKIETPVDNSLGLCTTL